MAATVDLHELNRFDRICDTRRFNGNFERQLRGRRAGTRGDVMTLQLADKIKSRDVRHSFKSIAVTAQLSSPIEPIDLETQWVLEQAGFVPRWRHHEGQDGRLAFGDRRCSIGVFALDPTDLERIFGGAHDAYDLDRDRGLTRVCKGVVCAGEVVQAHITALRSEIAGLKPMSECGTLNAARAGDEHV